MYKINDKIVYKKDVCIIKDIKKNSFTNEDCYVLTPITDQSLTINIPTSDKGGNIRDLISKKEVEQIINSIPSIDIINNNDKLIEYEYKNLMSTGKHEDLIKIIKTTYLRNKERIDNKKKIGDKDNNYFKQAEKYLYTEFSIVLDLPYEDTKKYVINKVSELTK